MSLLIILHGCFSIKSSSGGGEGVNFSGERNIKPQDIGLPEGYSIEAVAQNLTFPTGVAFDNEGTPLFKEYHNRCHPAGNAGLGPSIINKPLPGFLIRKQVREGLGAMPAFNKEHLTEEKLDNVIAYLKKIK